MVNIQLDSQQLQSLCDTLADTNNGFSKAELKRLLDHCSIVAVDDGIIRHNYSYETGLNKRNWLFNCFAYEINTNKSQHKIAVFIEKALNPIAFTSLSKRAKYDYLFEEINKVLLLVGLEVTNKGVLQETVRASTLDEIDERVNSLMKKLHARAIHHEVEKYCKSDYLRKDYYDAIFEASKGLAERVRQLSGLESDGGELFQTAFSLKHPYIFFNGLKTESEISEFKGVKELLEAIFHLARNPAAHTPKINWKTNETKALDVLTLISFTHKYLDECYPIPNIQK